MSNLKIEIFGPGCPKCMNTQELFMRALSEMNLPADLRHISDVDEMVKRGIMSTPAVFINGDKVIEGKVPTMPEVKKLIKQNLE
ncbi:thioredoxin family protein [candidate division TA06 bacterium B3_TA06]|uniref:Thioredoxin family protein n=1 Tax=candidate division TA06 bacterium B3_TA06 TaxID=2012487 RepID=A0A532V1Q0_UNCT6|nr:MAG: thioredoxin family protein [candidate division TA06 bacterium B3_TA06]